MGMYFCAKLERKKRKEKESVNVAVRVLQRLHKSLRCKATKEYSLFSWKTKVEEKLRMWSVREPLYIFFEKIENEKEKRKGIGKRWRKKRDGFRIILGNQSNNMTIIWCVMKGEKGRAINSRKCRHYCEEWTIFRPFTWALSWNLDRAAFFFSNFAP